MNYIYILPGARQKQEQLIRKVDAEVGWFGLVKENDMGILLIEDIVVPKQKVSKDEVDFDMDFLHEFMEKHPEDASRLRYAAHSHADHKAYFSGVDWGEYIQMMELAGVPYVACYIENKKGESCAQIEIFKLQGQDVRLSVEAELRTIVPEEILDWADKEIEDKVEIQKKETSTQGKASSSTHTDFSTVSDSDREVVTLTKGTEFFHVIWDRKDLPSSGKAILFTDTNRVVFMDGKFEKSYTLQEWDSLVESNKGKNSTTSDKEDKTAKKAQVNHDPKEEVKSHKSDEAKKKEKRAQQVALEIENLFCDDIKEPVYAFIGGYFFTLESPEEIDRVLADDPYWECDDGIEWQAQFMNDGHAGGRGLLLC